MVEKPKILKEKAKKSLMDVTKTANLQKSNMRELSLLI